MRITAKRGIIHINLTESAENNGANAELVKEMAKRFGRARKASLFGSPQKVKTFWDAGNSISVHAGNSVFVRCKIVRGLKSRTKTLELPDGADIGSVEIHNIERFAMRKR